MVSKRRKQEKNDVCRGQGCEIGASTLSPLEVILVGYGEHCNNGGGNQNMDSKYLEELVKTVDLGVCIPMQTVLGTWA